MLEPVIAFFERLVTEFTWRRLLFILTLIFLSIAGVTFFEIYTGHFRLGRIEQASALLDKLIAQSKTIDPNSTEGISDIHKALIGDLRQYVNPGQSPFLVPSWTLKFMAALGPWILVAIIMYIVNTNGGYRSLFGGILIVAIPLSFIGALLPDFTPHWINYIAYPSLSCLLVMIPLTIYGNRKKVA